MDTKSTNNKTKQKKGKEPVKKVQTCAYSGLPSVESYMVKTK